MRGSSPRRPMGPSRAERPAVGRGSAPTVNRWLRADLGISPAFLALLADEDCAGRTVLDGGTGRGRLALALAPRCGRVVGIDRDEAALTEARRVAATTGLGNVEFVCVDAEAGGYAAFEPDPPGAPLCMSSPIPQRAGRAPAPGAPLV